MSGLKRENAELRQASVLKAASAFLAAEHGGAQRPS